MKAGARLSDADLRQSAFVTTLKAEAALDCAHAPPTALNDGRREEPRRAALSEMAWWRGT